MTPPAFERLRELRAPVLVVLGEQDTPLVRRVTEATAALVPEAQLWRLPGADHLPQMVEPEAFTSRVTEFLRAP